MNRRTALLLTMLLGGASPASLWAQSSRARRAGGTKAGGSRLRPVSADEGAEEPGRDGRGRAAAAGEDPPVGFNESGFKWRSFDISRYTRAAQDQQNPQKAIVDWVFRRTGTAEWHGEKVASLSASRTQLRAYHSPEVLEQVAEVVERFTDVTEDVLSLHVRFVVAVDTRWRHSVFSRLTSVGSGPQGQQIWTMRTEDAALVYAQMQAQQGFRPLVDRQVDMINGQTLVVRTTDTRGYAGGLQREGALGQGFQPRADKLDESIILRLSPLLSFEGDSVDAAIELTVNTVRSFHRTKVIAPREVGPAEMAIDVPEASQTRLDQTVRNWPLGQTLLIGAGIHPGVLDKKGGWLGTPIGAPTSTEVLIFLDAETGGRNRSRSRDDRPTVAEPADEGSSDVDAAAEPEPRPRKGRRATRGPDVEAEPEL